MKENRDKAISVTLKWEGGYVNHPSDPGGATNYGITIHDVRKYIKADATPADVKAITKQQAIEIYTEKYWKNRYYNCDNLESGVDLAVFDFGVNSGPSRALKFLKKYKTADAICDARLAWLKTLKTWPTFGKGWERRVVDIKKECRKLANGPQIGPVTKAIVATTTVGGTTVAASPALWPWVVAAGVVVIAGVGLYFWLKGKKKNVKVVETKVG